MAYPVALALVLGIAVGSFLYYCFTQETPQAYGNGHHVKDDWVNDNYWNTTSSSQRRRRRLSSCELCSICQEPLADDTQELKCKDKFHSACIARWLAQQRICPNCRCTV